MKLLEIVVCAVLCCSCVHVHADVKSCTYEDSTGKVYDFSDLINPKGYYTFNQTVWSIGGFSLDSMSADTQVNVTLYLQVCRNLLVPPAGCKDRGAMYSVTSDGTCQSWGDANVAIFDPNPYKDGVNLKHYHGSMIDHISFNAGTIYFVCATADKEPFFEHIKAAVSQAHFKIFTHLAC